MEANGAGPSRFLHCRIPSTQHRAGQSGCSENSYSKNGSLAALGPALGASSCTPLWTSLAKGGQRKGKEMNPSPMPVVLEETER